MIPKTKATSDADWRDETLARMRALILEAEADMIEERKWRKPSNAMAGVPVWSHDGDRLHRRDVLDFQHGWINR